MLENNVTITNQTVFVTGAAGPVQSIMFGFLGAKMDYDDPAGELQFNPILPETWRSLKVTGITWKDRTFDVVIDKEGKTTIIDK